MKTKILILNDENPRRDVEVKDIVYQMNLKFTNQDDFEARLQSICAEIALQMEGRYLYDSRTDHHVFYFMAVTPEPTALRMLIDRAIMTNP